MKVIKRLMKKIIFLFVLIFSPFSIQSSTINFDCSVIKFFHSSDTEDNEFEDGNLKKRFVISINEQEILVTTISDTFNSNIRKYEIFKTDAQGVLYATRSSVVLSDMISIDPRNGDALISLQGAFILNAWFLKCNKQ